MSRAATRGILKIKVLSKNKINHINELLHFIWTILRGKSYLILLFCFIEALHVKLLWCRATTDVILGKNSLQSHILKTSIITRQPVLGCKQLDMWILD